MVTVYSGNCISMLAKTFLICIYIIIESLELAEDEPYLELKCTKIRMYTYDQLFVTNSNSNK